VLQDFVHLTKAMQVMLLLRALLLWSLVSLHVVGGAAVFRRLFPSESPWYGLLCRAWPWS